MRVALSLACIVLLTGCGKEAKAPLEATRAFYAAVLPLMGHGVPGDIRALRPHISANLAKLLNDAADAEDAYYKRTKGETPPMVEGDLFSSLAEGPTSFRVLSAQRRGVHWVCSVELSYRVPESKEEPYVWVDRATLIQEGGRWVVDDLDILVKGETNSTGTLKSGLAKIIKDGNDPDYK